MKQILIVLAFALLITVPAAAIEDRNGSLVNVGLGGRVVTTSFNDDATVIAAGTQGKGGVSILSENGSLLWEYPTGCPVYQVAVSGDGQSIAVASDKLRIFGRNGDLLQQFESDYFAFSTALSADGEYIAGGYDDSTLSLMTAGGQRRWTRSLEDDAVSLSLSSDGSLLAVGSKDEKVHLYNGQGTLLWSYETGNTVCSVSISPEGDYVAAGSYDKVLYFFDRNGTLLWRHVAGSRVLGVDVSAEGEYVAAAYGKQVVLLNAQGEVTGEFPASGIAESVAITPDGRYVAAGIGGGSPRVLVFEHIGAPVAEESDDGTAENPAVAMGNEGSSDLLKAFVLEPTGEVPEIAHIFNGVSVISVLLETPDPSSPASVRMSVDGAWVEDHGGADNVTIVAATPEGVHQVPAHAEIVETRFIGYDPEGRMVFEGHLPFGPTAYGVIAVPEWYRAENSAGPLPALPRLPGLAGAT
ncbi:WD40 repeat domain-containing protein [Methanofollis fontis]|nr:PQQ-binding-like beta-propeller repeat protein [Methanofollis fontis]